MMLHMIVVEYQGHNLLAALQGTPRYVHLAGCEYQGHNLLAAMGGHVVCGEARRMVWNLRPGFTPRTCEVRIPLGQLAREDRKSVV